MLVSVSLCWLLLTAPLNLHTMLALKKIRASSNDVHLLLKTICFCLLYVNHSINLLLYCFTGRKFRLELKVSFVTANPYYFALIIGLIVVILLLLLLLLIIIIIIIIII